MNVPLLDLKPQMDQLRPQLIEAVAKLIDSTQYILGPEVASFEQQIAAYCGAGFGVGVSSGTDALLNSLMSLDIGPGDAVLTTPYTFFATMGTILRVGAEPLFVDVEPESLNIDPAAVEAALAADSKGARRIKAMIPVHLFGQCADMQRLEELAAHYRVPVIEDAAQAIGAEFPFLENGVSRWQKAGSMGLAGCFSFFPSKNLGGIGDGGMITTSDEEFVEILRNNRNHGAHPKYYHARVGGNFRLAPVQAVVLAIKLPHLERWHGQRRRNAELYGQFFEQAGLVDAPVQLPRAVYAGSDLAEEHNHHIYNQYVIHVPKRDELRAHLQENAIGCEVYYPLCLHQQQCYKTDNPGSFPVAENAAATTLALPIYPDLTEEQIRFVVEIISQFYRNAA